MIRNFKEITAESFGTIQKYVNLRPIYIAERQFVNQFIWSGYYNLLYTTDDNALFFKAKVLGEDSIFMPFCKEADILSSFYNIKDYFNQEVKKPLKILFADEVFVNMLRTKEDIVNNFTFIPYRDSFDYIYDADKLRTLSGRKMHKKKNHLNNFLKRYEGRYEYRPLCCSNMEEVKEFHKSWLIQRQIDDPNNSIDQEEDGIFRLMSHCGEIDYRCGGVYIDGKLEAYSIGSYAPEIECAYIHIEKANPEIPGLYNYINQQFLLNEFSEAKLVNREDDLGQEGLRKSKTSYNPLRLEAKYVIIQNTYNGTPTDMSYFLERQVKENETVE